MTTKFGYVFICVLLCQMLIGCQNSRVIVRKPLPTDVSQTTPLAPSSKIDQLNFPEVNLPIEISVSPWIFEQIEDTVSGKTIIEWEESGEQFWAFLTVRRFPTTGEAENLMATELQFRDSNNYNSDSDVSFDSKTANEYEVGCGTPEWDDLPHCDLDARYQEYFLSFNMRISNDMNKSIFEQIVSDLDTQMGRLIETQ